MPDKASSPAAPAEREQFMAELDAMIVEQEGAVRFRAQEAKLEVLPAFHGKSPITGKRLDVDEDRNYGATHRRIGAQEQARLDALLAIRSILAGYRRAAEPKKLPCDRCGDDGHLTVRDMMSPDGREVFCGHCEKGRTMAADYHDALEAKGEERAR
jgi:hypothetical protein